MKNFNGSTELPHPRGRGRQNIQIAAAPFPELNMEGLKRQVRKGYIEFWKRRGVDPDKMK